MAKSASPILTALKAATQSEQAAVEFLEAQRWPEQPACPRCGSLNVYKMMGNRGGRNKDFRLRCRDCAKPNPTMFTVRTGTTFEESRLPLRIWVYAFWRACASKKGISALQLSREMEITHKSALFVLRRIRHGMGYNGGVKLRGTIEADEVFIGGKPRNRGRNKRGYTDKTPVVGLVQRNGDVRFRMMKRLTADEVAAVIAENVNLSSRLMSDESPAYAGIGREFSGGHQTTLHSRREYAKAGGVHSNTIESVFSLIKRGVMGTFHSITPKHLPNYLNEFEFRWNTRFADDGARVGKAIRAVEGKRLMYRESVDNPPYIVGGVKPQAAAPFDPIF